jgi:hypothetical protein
LKLERRGSPFLQQKFQEERPLKRGKIIIMIIITWTSWLLF